MVKIRNGCEKNIMSSDLYRKYSACLKLSELTETTEQMLSVHMNQMSKAFTGHFLHLNIYFYMYSCLM